MKVENVKQLVVFNAEHGHATFNEAPATPDWPALKRDLEDLLRQCADPQDEDDVKAAISAAEEEDESKFKRTLTRIADFAQSALANFAGTALASYLKANGLIP